LGEFIVFEPGETLIGDVVWQSSFFLLAGLAGRLILARRPARAHRVLLLAIVGALITPLCGQFVRRAGWGFWTTNPPDVDPPVASSTISTASRAASRASGAQDRATDASSHVTSAVEQRSAAIPTSTAAVRAGASARRVGEARSGLLDRLRFRAIVPTRLRNALVSLWCIVSGFSVIRLVVSLVRGHRVAVRARPIACESIEHAAGAACERLGLRVRPELRISPDADCPAIWCWGRRPVILLPTRGGGLAWGGETPSRPAGAESLGWAGVFCHELAHWVRRDQWSSLLGELVIAALPWHPLAWWARHRLGQLSELACDDWVLDTGLPAADYAESLLSLVPQRGARLALAAVSSRRGLVGRIHHILDERRSSPVVGPRWAVLSAAAMMLAASAVALAQTRPAVSKASSHRPKDQSGSENATIAAPANSKKTAAHHTIRGSVLGPDDKPVAGASVLLIGYTKPTVSEFAMPRDRRDQRNGPRDVLLDRTDTGTDGRYALGVDVEPEDLNSLLVVVFARGFGPHAHYLKKFRETVDASRIATTEATLRLAPPVTIHGRLLTPGGMPASGVRVTLEIIHGNKTQDALSVGQTPIDERIGSLWPKPTTTDADGWFILEAVPRGTYATLSLAHPDFAVDEVIVNTSADDPRTPGLFAGEISPVKPTFTHTLEPARPVQGRVTDKVTGKPLTGLLVEMVPMRQFGGRSFFARTDADGRYRVSGNAGAMFYFTTVYPPADSGYLSPGNERTRWPAGARFIEKDFALDKGRIVHGRVIDAETKRPIAGAAVIYQPKRGNPNNRNYEFRNTVLSDNDGRFSITALPGAGHLMVEATGEYVRTRLLSYQSERRALFPHGQAVVDVPATGEAAPVEITIRKGVTFTARVVGPDGRPVFPFAAFCPEMSGNAIYSGHASVNYLDQRFVFPGSNPSQTYKVIFASARHHLAAVVEIKPDPMGFQPVEIRLQPAARVHGKVVKPSGLPMPEGQVYPIIVLDKKPETMGRNEVLSQEIYSNLLESSARSKYHDRPGSQGEFTHDGLVPGMPYYIVATSGGREAFHYVPPLKPGEDRDLGTITLKERQP